MRSLALILLLSTGGGICAHAQTEANAGAISGVVTNASGQPVARANVTVAAQDRGIERQALTGDQGDWYVPALPPGTYTVRIAAAGYQTGTLEGAAVHVGETLSLRTPLAAAQGSAQGGASSSGPVIFRVDAAGKMPVVETGRTQQSSSIDAVRIDHLPINRRNYLDFTLLTPGAVGTNNMVDSVDYRTPQSPQSGVAFGGGNGRSNTFTIDGAENYLNTGGVRPSVSQEGVQEFQINRNSYSAEFGDATGGAINVVTRSGANETHGSVFGFLRQRQLQARNFFDSTKSAFTRGQYGASAGGALRQNRTFYFATFERLDRHETVFVPIAADRGAFTQLTPSQTQLASFLASSGSPSLAPLAGVMNALLLPSNFPRTIAMFNANSGNFPFSESSNQASLRLDHRFDRDHSLFLRGNLTTSFSPNTAFGALTALNRGRTQDQFDGTWLLADTLVLSPHLISETRAAFGFDNFNVSPVDPNGPQIDIAGYGSFNRPVFLPSKNIERHFQLDEILGWTHGAHHVKWGAQINPVRDAVVADLPQDGLFNFGADVPLGAVLNGVVGDPNFAASLAAVLPPSLAAALGAPITSLQAFNLGIPDYYFQGFGDPRWTGWTKRYSFFVQDSFRVSSRLSLYWGARYELEQKVKLFPGDHNNLAPRIGLAWDPKGDGKTVVRGGFGIYYGKIDSNVNYAAQVFAGNQIVAVLVPLSGLPGTIDPLTKQPLNSADIYGYLSAVGVLGKRTIAASDLAPLGLVPGPNLPLLTKFGVDPHFVNPYSEQASLEIERAVGRFSISASYNFNRGVHLVREHDQNIALAGRNPDGSAIVGFVNPLVLQNNVFESSANSYYNSLTLQVSRRFHRHFSLDAHYSLSRAIDDVTDFQTDYEPNNQLNERADRGLSPFHQKHRFVGNAVIDSPYHTARGERFVHNLLADFMVSPIVVANSGQPFNVLTGFDNVGDNHVTNHRPLGAGRDIGLGPDYFTADLRVSRQWRWGSSDARVLEFIAEGFNLLNRTNFQTVNNVVGNLTLSQLPHPLVGNAGPVTAPLSFTSALNPRQFQFGLRIRF
jgi:hypothetical protein